MKGFKFTITADIKGSVEEIEKAIKERGLEVVLVATKEMIEETINEEFGDLTNVNAVVEAIY